jgi:hypothetical protein
MKKSLVSLLTLFLVVSAQHNRGTTTAKLLIRIFIRKAGMITAAPAVRPGQSTGRTAPIIKLPAR